MQSLPELFIKITKEDQFQDFFVDLVTEFVQDRSRPYLGKYDMIESYREILQAQEFLKELAILILEHNLNTGKQISKLISKSKMKELSEEIQAIISFILMENIKGIKKMAVQIMIAMNQYTLIDFNWNLNISMASDNIYQSQIPFLLLQLVLKRLGKEDEKTIELELNKQELEDYLIKLKQIQSNVLDNDEMHNNN